MKNSFKLFAMLISISFLFVACEQSIVDSPVNPDVTDNSTYIVTLNVQGYSQQSAAFDSRINEILTKHNIAKESVQFIYSRVILGFAAQLNEEQLLSLQSDKNVIGIEKDQIYEVSDNFEISDAGTNVSAQRVSWGINAIGGSVNATNTTGIAWILDTGIDLTHPDLNVNTILSRTFITSGNDALSANDLHGHGSHVAGVVGAINNNIGAIGVCAGAELVAVKVLNFRGSGMTSQIIAGIDYVAANLVNGRINVVNFSLGGAASIALDNAVINLANAGAYVVLAAGNNSRSAITISPARVVGNRILTISAHDANGRFARFSNFGNPPIDYAAPGVSIYSTSRNGGYATMSGTSQAAPHVAGILLANGGTTNWSGNVTRDKDNSPDRKAVR